MKEWISWSCVSDLHLIMYHKLPSLLIYHKLRLLFIYHKPRSLLIYHKHRSLLIYHKPRSLLIYHKPQSLIIYHKPRSLLIYHKPRSLLMYHKPRSLLIYQNLDLYLYIQTSTLHYFSKRTLFTSLSTTRIEPSGMSKLLIPEGQGNEPSISWARHQMVVTKHKDDEFLSSSNYAVFDSANPVVNFSSFYADNENIVDEVSVIKILFTMSNTRITVCER